MPGQLTVQSIGEDSGGIRSGHVAPPLGMGNHAAPHIARIHTSGCRTGTRIAQPSQSAVEV